MRDPLKKGFQTQSQMDGVMVPLFSCALLKVGPCSKCGGNHYNLPSVFRPGRVSTRFQRSLGHVPLSAEVGCSEPAKVADIPYDAAWSLEVVRVTAVCFRSIDSPCPSV